MALSNWRKTSTMSDEWSTINCHQTRNMTIQILESIRGYSEFNCIVSFNASQCQCEMVQLKSFVQLKLVSNTQRTISMILVFVIDSNLFPNSNRDVRDEHLG
ncbi:hypothetical protein BLOT_014161 [Blomia tropicalis]|nr:hypothetical protein BLOT_014161 [Blomia tropicalis]